MESESRARRKRATRRKKLDRRLVGEYTLSRILAPFRAGGKLATHFVAEKIAGVLEQSCEKLFFQAIVKRMRSLQFFTKFTFMGNCN